jgi:hypothetical protein
MLHGEEGLKDLLSPEKNKLDPEMKPDVQDQEYVMKAAADAGKLLGERLSSGHDRKEVTKKVMDQMMKMIKAW